MCERERGEGGEGDEMCVGVYEGGGGWCVCVGMEGVTHPNLWNW